jgi:FolB domain-containing protein
MGAPTSCETSGGYRSLMDRILIKDLVVSGIIGINPEERTTRQDVAVNLVLHVDTSPAARSDDIGDAVNYRTIAKQVIEHVQIGEPMLVERLAQEIADICLADPRVRDVEVTVEKPGALRFARSVGISIIRSNVAHRTPHTSEIEGGP